MARIDIKYYRSLQERRIQKLKEGKRRGPVTSAKFMALQLRKLVPLGKEEHAGYPHMYQTIKQAGNVVSISGMNPNTGFPYIFWVNEIPGYETIRTPKGRRLAFRQTQPNGSRAAFYQLALTRTRQFNTNSTLNMTRQSIIAAF